MVTFSPFTHWWVQGAGQDGRRTQTEAATRQGGVATADGGSSGLRKLISATRNSDDVGISCRYDGDECNNMIQSDKYLGLSQNCKLMKIHNVSSQ